MKIKADISSIASGQFYITMFAEFVSGYGIYNLIRKMNKTFLILITLYSIYGKSSYNCTGGDI